MLNDVVHMLRDEVAAGTVPGAVVTVCDGGEPQTAAVGKMAVGGPEMRTDAIMRIQSMTKSLTTVAALLHVQHGDLALEDPVSRWLPELSAPKVLRTPDAELDDVVDPERPIRVRDLLVNASGYGFQTADTPLARAVQEAGLAAGAEPVSLGANDWLRRLAEFPLTFQPGQGFRYHDSFALLGILLQRLTHVPLDQHLREIVCEPLGMVDTSFWVPQAKAGRLPAAYRHGDDGLTETEPLGGGFYAGPPPFDVSHGEVVSTAADFSRFLGMLAAGGRHDDHVFLDPGLLAEMTRDQVPAEVKTPDSFFPGFWDGMGWGYGVGVVTDGPRTGRYGWSGGQGTDLFVDPDGGFGILLTQVELGERMWPVVNRFGELAR